MKKTFINLVVAISFICISNNLNGQNKVYLGTPRADKENDSIKNELQRVGVLSTVNKRETNLEFYKTQLLITEPGTLSGACVTDFTFNQNKNYQKKPFILNGDILLPIGFGGKRWGLNTLQFIPEVKIRILRNDKSQGDSSLPVRTPSYLPTLIYYFSCKHWNTMVNNRRRFIFGGLKAFHHSNGQDGNEFDSTGKINTYNGNFGENLAFEVSGGFSKQVDYNNKGKDTTQPNAMIYSKIGFEFHPNALSNTDLSMYHLYGRYRINAQFGFFKSTNYNEFILDTLCPRTRYQVVRNVLKERWRFVGNFTYIADGIYNTGDNIHNLKAEPFLSLKRLNIYATGFFIIPGSVNAAAFVQIGYWGSDTYNIYFAQSLVHFRFGLAFAFFKYPTSGDLVKNVYKSI